jgi:hypothetical protein
MSLKLFCLIERIKEFLKKSSTKGCCGKLWITLGIEVKRHYQNMMKHFVFCL